MRRWFFHFLAGVSGVVFLLGVVMWVRGYWIEDSLNQVAGGVATFMKAGDGGVYAMRIWFPLNVVPEKPLEFRHTSRVGQALNMESNVSPDPVAWKHHWKIPGFFFEQRDRFVAVSLSYGWFAGLSAVLPAWWGVRFWRRRQRVRGGHCRECGYDLRASVGRCPECGEGIGDMPVKGPVEL